MSDPEPQEIVSTAPSKVSGVKAVGAVRAVKVTWKGASGVAGYQIRYRLKGASAWKSKTVKDALATSTKIAGLKQGKKYTVQIRAWRLKPVGSGKLYGSWSASKIVKSK